MARQGINQCFIQTKLKHRKKLNAKYDPRRRMRLTFTEHYSESFTRLLQAWCNYITGVTANGQ